MEHHDAAIACMQEEDAQARAQAQLLQARQAQLRQQLAERCTDAEQQQDGISAALTALAARLDRLAVGSGGGGVGGAAPLVGLELPDAYASACTSLLDGLAGYVQHHSSSSEGDASSNPVAQQQRHQAAAAELAQLQACLCKQARLRVLEEAELARLRAQLHALQAPGSSAAAAPASLGLSAADLQAEVEALRGRQAAALQQAADAAGAAEAVGAGAEAVEEQCRLRRAAAEQRLQAKRQVEAVLRGHLARQVLASQLAGHERRALQRAGAAAVAALQDAQQALEAAQQRLPGYAAQQQRQEGPAAAVGEAAPAVASCSGGGGDGRDEGTDPVSTALQLLECRAQLQALSEQVQRDALPAHRALLQQLHGQLYGDDSGGGGRCGRGGGGSDGASTSCPSAPATGTLPQLSLPGVAEGLAAASAAHAELQRQAHAVMAEVGERQGAAGDRQLAEQVLLHFWTAPGRLVALEEKQRRQLEAYA